jgi:hypothetical protein
LYNFLNCKLYFVSVILALFLAFHYKKFSIQKLEARIAFSFSAPVTKVKQIAKPCRSSSEAARFRPWSGRAGFVVDEATLRQVFSEYFGFPCQTFHCLLHAHHHNIVQGWYNRPVWTPVIVDWVPFRSAKIKPSSG